MDENNRMRIISVKPAAKAVAADDENKGLSNLIAQYSSESDNGSENNDHNKDENELSKSGKDSEDSPTSSSPSADMSSKPEAAADAMNRPRKKLRVDVGSEFVLDGDASSQSDAQTRASLQKLVTRFEQAEGELDMVGISHGNASEGAIVDAEGSVEADLAEFERDVAMDLAALDNSQKFADVDVDVEYLEMVAERADGDFDEAEDERERRSQQNLAARVRRLGRKLEKRSARRARRKDK